MSANGTNGNGHHPRRWHFGRTKRQELGTANMAPYRRLALQLHYEVRRADKGRSVLLVTPGASSACARASLMLAAAFAEQLAKPVLLVDASPTSPEATRLVGATGAGLSEFLTDAGSSLCDFVVPTTTANVHFLPAGQAQPFLHERIDALLTQAAAHYDVTLLAGGSVLSDALSLALSPSAECVLLVVNENETRVEDLDAAQSTLGYCKARNVGLLLTTPRLPG